MVVRYWPPPGPRSGACPRADHIVIERFFDDSEGTQLIVHAPFGGRINRALGLALRKRFCVSFDFELQAAANDDTVVLSLGPQHSFPLDSVPRFCRGNRRRGAAPGGAALTHARRPLAVEPQPVPGVLRFRGGPRTRRPSSAWRPTT